MTETTNTEKKESIFKKPFVQSIIGIVVVVILLLGFIYWQSKRGTVYIENSYIDAPVISLSPDMPGTLNALYVHDGDVIAANTPVALVGTEIVTAKLGGIISDAPNDIGQYFAPGQSVVSMIDTSDIRVIGQIDENKGLKYIQPGQRATFTVDAFGNKQFEGVVDEVGATADTTGVAFDISDERPTKQFDIKVRFDATKYPQLKNGMSAKITVYTL